MTFEEFLQNLKNDIRNEYHLRYIGSEGLEEDFVGSDQIPMVLTTLSTIENPDLNIILLSKKEDFVALDLNDITISLFPHGKQINSSDLKKLRQQSKHVLEECISLIDVFDFGNSQKNKTPTYSKSQSQSHKKKLFENNINTDEDDELNNIQNMKLSNMENESEPDSIGGVPSRPNHFHTTSNKSNKSSKSITFQENASNHNPSEHSNFKKHTKNKQSQYSNRSSKSKSGDIFFNMHKVNNKSVDFSQEHKGAIVDISDNDNDADNYDDNNNETENENKNQNSIDEVSKTLEDLCDVLREMDIHIDVVEQSSSNTSVITFRIIPPHTSLSRQKSGVGTVQYKEWNGFGDINKDSNLMFDDSFFEDGFVIEGSFVSVKFDFENVPHLRSKWDDIFASFGSTSSIQHVMNTLLKGEKNVNVDVIDKISKDLMIMQFFSNV